MAAHAAKVVTLPSGSWRVHRTPLKDVPPDEAPEESVVLRLVGSDRSAIRLPGPLPAGLPCEELAWLARMSVTRELEVDGGLYECVATYSRPGFVLRDGNGHPRGNGRLPEGRTLCDVTDSDLAAEVRRLIVI